MWLNGLIQLMPVLLQLVAGNGLQTELSMEAAFQGQCGRGSPCMQLCYELHDGMYECDCMEGYELDKNGYSCQEINSTLQTNEGELLKTEEDVLYQKGASFSAKLDNSHHGNSNSLEENASNDSSDDSGSDESFMNSILSSAPDADDIRIISDKLKFTGRGDGTAVSSKATTTTPPARQNEIVQNSEISYYTSKEDMSVFDDVNNNRLNLRHANAMYQEPNQNEKSMENESTDDFATTFTSTTAPAAVVVSAMVTTSAPAETSRSYIHINEYRAEKQTSDTAKEVTIKAETITSSKEYRLRDNAGKHVSREPCQLDCGLDGVCENTNGIMRCRCPFGKAGYKCEENVKLNVPRFTRKSWMAFAALRGAYKHVQLHIEFRPESFDGIILLTGERDDLTGDFMAVLIHQGFIEFWFDCGSGTGKVRSDETVVLNQWNSITVYRHRWDAWILLNEGNRVQGRSKGLFSRITFREPVFLGGTGNITGLARKLPVLDGMTGCIRKFIANDHEYEFSSGQHGDVTQGFDVQECTSDRCGPYPCHHGGKCLPSDQGAICLCPLGFGGDMCEMRLDLQVPSFNGSSYLRLPPLGDSSLIWFELKMIIKPQLKDGLLLYSGHHEYGDFISLCLNAGYVEFSFDLGSGPAVVRSELPLTMARWHTIKVSRTARLAVLKVDQLPEVMTISPNGFWHLSLPHSLFLGGVQNIQNVPLTIRERGSFVGCIQKIEINGRSLTIIAEALGGTNVDNCPHACVARPCGPLASCIPNLDNYECHCNPSNAQCNKAEELPDLAVTIKHHLGPIITTTDMPITKGVAKSAQMHHSKTDTLTIRQHVLNMHMKALTTRRPSTTTVMQPTVNTMPRDSDNVIDRSEENSDTEYYDDDYDYEYDEKKSRESIENKTTYSSGAEQDVIVELPSVAWASGRYMSVDNDRLMQIDEIAKSSASNRSRKLKKSTTVIKETKIGLRPHLNSSNASRSHVEGIESPAADAAAAKTMNLYSGEDVLATKELIDDMERIMKNGDDIRAHAAAATAAATKHNKNRSPMKGRGACFTGADSYFHYNDAETMRQVISYKIDLNLRFKTHSVNGLILWTGRHSALEEDDYLSLGIENGYLHLRYNLGSGEVNIQYNATRVSDGLWHRIRAFRDHQEGSLEVDGGRTIVERSPGKLSQLNTDTGLYVGGMPDVLYYTRRRYASGIVGCISEIVLAGELRLSLDPETLGTAHNVEPGIF